ncbi:MAG: peptide chain release factor N(5)-glutamine methyltransferase [Verrucomicrobiota bacterium]
MLTVLEIIKRTTEFLSSKGIESPRLNAELLIGHALGRKRMQLYMEFERPLAEAELEKIRPLVRRRSQHEPLQYIVGDTDFCGLTLKTDRRALIPRPETEYLVELIGGAGLEPPARILDLGTGSGALALALAQAYPAASVVATDTSAEALALAQENATATGLGERVTFLRSDWWSALPLEPFDLIVSNPPYLTAEETAQTHPEVRGFEPYQALTGKGEDGSGDLVAIIAGARRYLKDGGLLALETGIAQHARLLGLLADAGFKNGESRRDLTGRDRFVFARG